MGRLQRSADVYKVLATGFSDESRDVADGSLVVLCQIVVGLSRQRR